VRRDELRARQLMREGVLKAIARARARAGGETGFL
jgi:hypothetical protein